MTVPGNVPDGTSPDGGPGAPWLHTSANHIRTADGSVWHGRGANLSDTRSCNACTYATASYPDEVMRRADELIDVWKANFIRLDLESYASATVGSPTARAHWQGVLDDAAYLAELKSIVDHIGAKGAYVLVSLWADPTFSQRSDVSEVGWPTAQTNAVLAELAATFASDPHVLLGVCNEPQGNFDGALDARAWAAMDSAVAAIRSVEDAAGVPHHIVAVQGTGGWARRLDYYVTHPIAAGGGANVAYEVHVYNRAADFPSLFVNAAQTLPVIIGEFGLANMTEGDVQVLQRRAEQLEIPHLAWTFHMRCPPNLLVDNSAGGCGVGMELQPTAWGQLLKNRLAIPW